MAVEIACVTIGVGVFVRVGVPTGPGVPETGVFVGPGVPGVLVGPGVPGVVVEAGVRVGVVAGQVSSTLEISAVVTPVVKLMTASLIAITSPSQNRKFCWTTESASSMS